MTDFVFPRMVELLRRLDIRPVKHRSQHFLRNQGVCAQIADLCLLSADHLAVEVGAGLGNLTTELARRAGKVVSVEMDRTFVEWHATIAEAFPQLEFRYEDFLKTDLSALAEAFPTQRKVAVGNLPYQITAPILFRLIEGPIQWERIVVMVQREVADRMVVGAGDRQASALTYKLNLLYDARLAIKLPPPEFIPPPKVNSAVVVLTPRATPLVSGVEQRVMAFDLISGVFQYRRKTLANALTLSGLLPGRPVAIEALTAAGLDEMRRPDSLTLEEVVALSRTVAEARRR